MASIKNLLIRLGVITDDVDSPVNRTTRGLEKVARQADHTERGLGRLGIQFDSVGSAASRITSNIAGFTGRLASMGVSLVTGAAALASLSAALAATAYGAVALVAAIAPAGGIFAALPGVVLLGAAAIGTLKVALSGVGTAFGTALSGDYAKFMEGTKDLSAAASEVAYELFQMAPAFKGLKDAVENALFAPLVGQMWSLDPAIDAVRDGMVGVAREYGLAALAVVGFIRSAETISAVRRIFEDLRGSIADVTPALTPLLAGFRDIGVVGSGFLSGLAPSLSAAVARFGEFLSKAAESGRALEWMDSALAVFKALGSIAKDVGGIISGTLGAAEKAGTGALGIIGQLLDKVNAFINSSKGQEILVTIFQSLEKVGRALGPVVEALARGLATIAPGVAAVAVAFGPVVSTIINALAPALAALEPGLVAIGEALAKAFAQPDVLTALLALGMGISAVLIGLAPLIPPLIEIAAILVERVGSALIELAALLAPVIAALAQSLGPVLPVIAQLLRDLAAAVLPLVKQLGGELAGAFRDLLVVMLPVAEQFGSALAAALRDLMPYLPPIMDALREVGGEILAAILEVLPQVLPHFKDLALAFGELFIEVAKILPDLIKFGGEILVTIIRQLPILLPMIKDLALQFLDVFKQLVPLIPSLLKLLLEVVLPLIPQLPKLLPPLIELARVFTDLLREATPLIKKLLESETVATIVKIGARNMVLAFDLVKDAINFAVGAIQIFIGTFFGLPGQVDAGLGKMGNAIKGWVNSIIGWFESVINILAGAIPGVGAVTFPRLANGGIFDTATMAMIGEAGKEVVIPLTRPRRAMELAEQSGLTGMLAGMGAAKAPSGGGGGRAGGVDIAGDLVLNINGADMDWKNIRQTGRDILHHIREGLIDIDREQM